MVELTKETIPKASRVAMLAYSSGLNWKLYFKHMDSAAQSLGVQLLALEVRELDELESAFDSARSKRADALIVPLWRIGSLQRANFRACCSESICRR